MIGFIILAFVLGTFTLIGVSVVLDHNPRLLSAVQYINSCLDGN